MADKVNNGSNEGRVPLKRFNCQQLGPGILWNTAELKLGDRSCLPAVLSAQQVLLWPQAAQLPMLPFASITGIYNIYFNIARFFGSHPTTDSSPHSDHGLNPFPSPHCVCVIVPNCL